MRLNVVSHRTQRFKMNRNPFSADGWSSIDMDRTGSS